MRRMTVVLPTSGGPVSSRMRLAAVLFVLTGLTMNFAVKITLPDGHAAAGHPVRPCYHAAEQSIHGRRSADARAWHRREHCDVLGHLRRAAATASLSEREPTGEALGRAPGRRVAPGRLSQTEQPDLLRLGAGAAND